MLESESNHGNGHSQDRRRDKQEQAQRYHGLTLPSKDSASDVSIVFGSAAPGVVSR